MTIRYNPENERIKRVYFEYVKEAKGRHKDTIRGVDKAIRRFEVFTRYADFSTFSKEQAIGFKKSLTVGGLGGQPSPRYSLSTLLHTVKPLQDFFQWLRQEKGYGQIKQNEIAYLNLSEHERQLATLPQERPTATLEQLTKVIEMMPCDTITQRRDRALLSLIGMTGIRDGAVIGLRVKHYQEAENCIHQHPDHVRTKKSKLIDSFLLPVNPEWLRYFKEWVQELKSEHLFGLDDPLFPKTDVICDPESLSFKEKGIQKVFWANSAPVRKILKEACIRCDIVPIKPHSIRKTLTLWAENACQTPEEFKAFSQNLGHNSPLTTFTSYGSISKHRQGNLIKGLGKPKQPDPSADIMKQLQQMLDERLPVK
jgi:integrase